MKSLILTMLIILGTYLCSTAVWQIDTVDSTGNVGMYSSIAIDSSTHPHISYQSVMGSISTYSLKYAHFDGYGWLTPTVQGGGSSLSVGWCTSIALDSSNNPRISHGISTYTNYLGYAYSNGTSWQTTFVYPAESSAFYTSIALDSSNNPRIAFYDNGSLKYARYDGSNWQISTVDTAGGEVWTSIELDSTNNPHISYCTGDYTDDRLKYAYYNGSSWQKSIVDFVGSVGGYSSLALDNTNNPHISYYDETNGALKYARKNGTSWQISMVDSAGDVGKYTSIALDSANNPRISYYDETNGALKYARYNGTSWLISVVDSAGDVGQYTSIALDSANNPHISYYDETNQDLKYAYNNTGIGITLLTFAAQPQPNSSIKLLWQVSSSESSGILCFNLYRAQEGKAGKEDWIKLNQSPIIGNNPYQFVDSSTKAGQTYQYRLSALTSDGKEEMLGSTQGSAGSTPAQFALTVVYPNPTSSLLTCRLTMPQADSVTLGLYDISGRMVLSKRLELAAGEQEIAVEAGDLARGIYTVRASSGGESAIKRIVVMR